MNNHKAQPGEIIGNPCHKRFINLPPEQRGALCDKILMEQRQIERSNNTQAIVALVFLGILMMACAFAAGLRLEKQKKLGTELPLAPYSMNDATGEVLK